MPRPGYTEYHQAFPGAAIGPAGSVCLMHTRVVHSSEANRSPSPRAEDFMRFVSYDANVS